MKRAMLLIALAVAGCGVDPHEAERGLLRVKLAQRCIDNLPAGPVKTHYNDWAEVVEACSNTAFYQSNGCTDPGLCMAALFPNEKAPQP